jgi:hypothetical protein
MMKSDHGNILELVAWNFIFGHTINYSSNILCIDY